jgi:hypothetical protein
MKPRYIKLTSGQQVRILFNMNSLGEFTSLTGKELTDFVGNKVDILMLRVIAWCTAVEGEEAEGRSLSLDEKQFGRLMDMQAIIEFSQILAEQSTTAAQKKSDPPGRSPKIFFRRKD